jgi:hypothetical protein
MGSLIMLATSDEYKTPFEYESSDVEVRSVLPVVIK